MAFRLNLKALLLRFVNGNGQTGQISMDEIVELCFLIIDMPGQDQSPHFLWVGKWQFDEIG